MGALLDRNVTDVVNVLGPWYETCESRWDGRDGRDLKFRTLQPSYRFARPRLSRSSLMSRVALVVLFPPVSPLSLESGIAFRDS